MDLTRSFSPTPGFLLCATGVVLQASLRSAGPRGLVEVGSPLWRAGAAVLVHRGDHSSQDARAVLHDRRVDFRRPAGAAVKLPRPARLDAVTSSCVTSTGHRRGRCTMRARGRDAAEPPGLFARALVALQATSPVAAALCIALRGLDARSRSTVGRSLVGPSVLDLEDPRGALERGARLRAHRPLSPARAKRHRTLQTLFGPFSRPRAGLSERQALPCSCARRACGVR